MSTSSTNTFAGPYSTDGSTTIFPFTFSAASASEVMVTLNDIPVATGLYAISLFPTGGGQVFFTSPPIAGATLYVRSNPSFMQQINFANQGAFLPAAFNEGLDRSVIRDLYLFDKITNGIKGDKGDPGSFGEGFATRALLAAVVATDYDDAYLSETGRAGKFIYRVGNYTAQIASDPLQGLYVAQASDPTGSGGAWIRQWNRIQGQPEWFGATTNNGTYDNRTAINACEALCPIVLYADADYFCQGTLALATNYRKHLGVEGNPDNTGYGTRIILANASGLTGLSTVAQIGKTSVPTNLIGDTALRIMVENVSFVRDGIPTTPVSGKIIDAAKGVILSNVTAAAVRNCKSVGSSVGFQIFGTVRSFVANCQATTAGPSGCPTAGALIGGYASNFGLAGANASLYVDDLVANGGGGSLNPTGVLLFGYFADTFIRRLETGSQVYGLLIDGAGSVGGTISAVSAHQDVKIEHPVNDGCSGAAILIQNTNSSGTITVIDAYGAVNGSGSGVYLNNSGAMVTVLGGEVLGSGSSYGLRTVGSVRYTVNGLKLRDCSIPVKLSDAHQFEVRAQINNPNTTAAGAAIELAGLCARGTVAGSIDGKASAFSMGVNVGTSTGYVEFNTSAHNQGAYATVTSAYKIRWGGTADANGNSAFTTAGNVLVGVTG